MSAVDILAAFIFPTFFIACLFSHPYNSRLLRTLSSMLFGFSLGVLFILIPIFMWKGVA